MHEKILFETFFHFFCRQKCCNPSVTAKANVKLFSYQSEKNLFLRSDVSIYNNEYSFSCMCVTQCLSMDA